MANFFQLSTVALAIAAAFSAPSGAYAQAEVPAKTSAGEASGGHEDAIENSPLKKTPAVKRAESAVKDGVQQVTITGGRQSDVDARRLSTAGKIIFGREELDRHKKYCQVLHCNILVNARPDPGFSLSLVALAIAAAFSAPSGAYAQAETPVKASANESQMGLKTLAKSHS